MAERLEDRIRKMLVERLFMKISPGEIEENASLIEQYGVDSVSLLELVVGIEEEFGVAVADEDFSVEHFETVAALAEFVRAKTPASEGTG
jgi:acyl carrier protein